MEMEILEFNSITEFLVGWKFLSLIPLIEFLGLIQFIWEFFSLISVIVET